MLKIRRIIMAFCILGFVAALWSCSHFFRQASRYDSRKISIQVLPLFNQRKFLPDQAGQTWKGDWAFRRERLELIDQQIRQIRPDLLIFQNLMAKKESASDSDRAIFSAGSLLGYHWQSVDLDEFPDTLEVESMGMVSDFPLPKSPQEGYRRFWKMGEDSYLAAFRTELEGHGVAVFNLELSQELGQQERWYYFIKDRISETLKDYGLCSRRAIVGGSFGGNEAQKDYRYLLSSLQLTDSSIGFCEQESDCYTDSSENELFLKTEGDLRPGRSIRVLLHQGSLIYSGGRNFDQASRKSRFAGSLAMKSIPPTRYYGWLTVARLARCPDEVSLED